MYKINIDANQTILADINGYGYITVEKIDENDNIIHTQSYRCYVYDFSDEEKNKPYVVEWYNAGNDMPEYTIVDNTPTFEQNKTIKISKINAKTQEKLYGGVPATVNGEEYIFDTCKGERAAANWQKLSDISGKVITGILPSDGLFPRNISTKDDEEVLEISTASDAVAFLVSLWTNEASIITEGAILRKSAKDATTQEELDSIIDDR